ncbi:hypothetical protein ACEYYB_09535 [Paracoccus sp. p4-l81]|uniref:hypothetical protein n=1 Tax=Paracoccus sp. p4-l81 TaxID=3342806 RepID=UPI0035B7BDA5
MIRMMMMAAALTAPAVTPARAQIGPADVGGPVQSHSFAQARMIGDDPQISTQGRIVAAGAEGADAAGTFAVAGQAGSARSDAGIPARYRHGGTGRSFWDGGDDPLTAGGGAIGRAANVDSGDDAGAAADAGGDAGSTPQDNDKNGDGISDDYDWDDVSTWDDEPFPDDGDGGDGSDGDSGDDPADVPDDDADGAGDETADDMGGDEDATSDDADGDMTGQGAA